MKFKPLSNYILIKADSTPDTTPSGIVLPESSKEKPNKGEVISMGEGITTDSGNAIPLYVKIGDIVYFQRYSGIEIKIDKVSYLLMRESELLGILSLE